MGKNTTVHAIILALLLLPVAFAATSPQPLQITRADVAAAATIQQTTHDTLVTIDPSITQCGDLNNPTTYTVTVQNLANSTKSIKEVRIYSDVDLNGVQDPGIASFACGPAPNAAWTLTDFLNPFNFCLYQTQLNSSQLIDPGESLDFTFDATLNDLSQACGNQFLISSTDNDAPFGNVVYKYPDVKVDCTPPVITKTVSQPNIPMNNCDPNVTSCDYWIRYSTDLDFQATDNAQCDLGLDICTWDVYIDDTFAGQYSSSNDANAAVMNWKLEYGEDSEHFVTVTCTDLAGNSATFTETDKVDDTPPVTNHTYNGPQQNVNGVQWIDGVSTITLNAIDPDPTTFSCNIGVNRTEYCIKLVNDQYCANGEGCFLTQAAAAADTDIAGGSCNWQVYDGNPIANIPESCHKIIYRSVDHLGNKEYYNHACFFVDKTPPLLTKDNGKAIVGAGELNFTTQANPEGEFHWITSSMPITFTCTDQLPHPAGGEEVCYKVGYDVPNWETDVTASYCNGQLDNGYCCVPVDQQDQFVFNFKQGEDSQHSLEYFCRDAVDKATVPHTQYYKVDNTPPTIEKDMFGSWLGQCPPAPNSNEICYVADNGQSGVDVTVTDGGAICAVDQVSCSYQIMWHGVTQNVCENATNQGTWDVNSQLCLIDSGVFTDGAERIIFGEDSTHDLIITCNDALGNTVTDTEQFRVDSTPPVTEKSYGEPFWSCTDWCTDYCASQNGYPTSTQTVYDCQSMCEQNSCGGYDGNAPYEAYPHWITSASLVTLNATDNKVGVNDTLYRVTLLDNTSCYDIDVCATAYRAQQSQAPFASYADPGFQIPEDSCHLIEYQSSDLLGNTETMKYQCVFVDNLPPSGVKTVGLPNVPVNGCNPQNESCDYYVTQATDITLDCTDAQPHPVGHEEVCFTVKYNGNDVTDQYCQQLGQGAGQVSPGQPCCIYNPTAELSFTEDSEHELTYWCEDALGNENQPDTETFYVETVGPQTTHTVTGPVYSNGTATYIDNVTRIELDAIDPDPHPSGVDETYYRWERVEDAYCEGTFDVSDFNTAGGYENVNLLALPPSPSDGLWYVNGATGGIDAESSSGNPGTHQYVADSTAPLGFGALEMSINNAGVAWRSAAHKGTPLADITTLTYSTYSTNGNSYPSLQLEWDKDCLITGYDGNLVFIPQDNTDVGANAATAGQWQTWDGLAGTWTHSQNFSASWTWAQLLAAYPNACIRPDFGRIGVKLGTDNTAETTRVDAVAFNSRTYDMEPQGTFLAYEGEFGIPEESCHVVQYYSVDNLGNEEPVNSVFYYADHAAPNTTKTYGQPFVYDAQTGQEWGNTSTTVTLAAVDNEPHPSGVDATYYRWEMVADDACGPQAQSICDAQVLTAPWQPYSTPFTIDEESCHAIEFYSVDNVGKTEVVTRQCIAIDETAPLPNKTVGLPNGPWNGNGDFFQVQQECSVPGTCYTVTTLTPIHLSCADQLPHPVGDTSVHFQVIYDPSPNDAGDLTAQYCAEVGGVIGPDGYCVVNDDVTLLFHEESEHQLDFYCTDGLGNIGPSDLEWFKVSGSAFNITLHKKWNLISVPFKLLDNQMNKVFENVNDTVLSVWTYDAQTGDWYVYTPDGDSSNDDLTTMLPGWGYWVLSSDNDTLVIAGSLFQAGPNTPVSKPIVGGAWNLIGYYGTENLVSYDGPVGAGDMSSCHLNSIAGSIWTQDFTGLFGYWSPLPVNGFFEIDSYTNLDPGAGYWAFSTEDGVYAPSTTCPGIPLFFP